MTSTAQRPTLSVAETAQLLGISRWLVQQAVHDGSLPSVRVGRRILIHTPGCWPGSRVTCLTTVSALQVDLSTPLVTLTW